MSSIPPISPDLPDELIDLGIILGVVTTNGSGPQLNTGWFGDPVENVKGVLRDEARRRTLVERATALFGDATDLDIPVGGSDDDAWIPLAEVPAGGLYAVIDTRGTSPVVGLGARIAVARDGVDASLTVRVPLVAADAAGIALLLGSAGGVVEAAATVTVEGLGVPGIVELDGISLSALLPTDGTDPSLTVVARNLLLPGDPAPADVALGALLDEVGPVGVQIFVGLLSSQTEAPPAVTDLLGLVGLDADDGIPPLPLVDVITVGPPALRAWVADVIDVALDDWLTRLGSFLGGDDGPITPEGVGTPVDPHRVCISSVDGGLQVDACLTLAVETDAAAGSTAVTPGASLRVRKVADAAVPGFVEGSLTFGRLLLDQGFSVAAGPTLRAIAQLGDGDLLDADVDGTDVGVGALRGGLASTADGELTAVLEATDVHIGEATYAVLDLSDAGAVLEVATGGLVDTVLAALDIAANPEARALAILAGLAAPDGAVDWPQVSLTDLFADPIGAIGCYHADVLSVDGRWQEVAEQVAMLLRSVVSIDPSVSGTGTAADPWTVTLLDATGSGDAIAGRVDLVAWATGTADGPTLTIGLETRPSVDLSGLAADVRYRAAILDVALPPADACPGPVGLTWARTHAVTLAVEEPAIVLDPVTVAADRLELGLVLDRMTGLTPQCVVSNPAVTIDGVAVALPELDLGDPPDLGELPWPVLQQLVGDWLDGFGSEPLDQLVALLGWSPGDPPAFTFPQLPDLDVDVPPLPPLDLQRLVTDPLAALAAWLTALATGGDTPVELPPFVVAIGRLAEGLAGGHTPLTLDGRGTYDDPWAICVAGGPLELLVWLDPDGPALGGATGVVEHLLPDDVLDDADLPTVFGLLDRAAGLVPDIADRITDVDALHTGIETIREILEGDGLVTAAAQRVDGWDEITLQPAAHLDEPAAFVMPQAVSDDVAPQGWVFVSSAALPGVSGWAGQDGATVIDLTQPGIRPESIDLSQISAGGPWHVLLPSRADAFVAADPGITGVERLRARLRRAVDHIHGIVGGDLALIAHSTAGQVARLVASGPVAETHITHVVTVGTPHGGATFEFLDRPETAEALRTLQRLQRLLDPDDPVPVLTDRLTTLGAALDPYVPGDGGIMAFVGFPAEDFVIPVTYPDVDAGTTGHAVVGSVITADLDAALVDLVRRAITAAIARLPTGEQVSHLGLGVRARLVEPAAEPGTLAVSARARVDLHRVRIAAGQAPRQIPFVSADLELRRTGGWLVGGPDPTRAPGAPRDPRARWLEAHLRADPTDLADGDVQIIVHDASIFGTYHERWVVDSSTFVADRTLLPEVRILLGEIAAGLGTLVTDTAIEQLSGLIAALGLGEITDGRLTLVTDALERFIIDPVGEIRLRLATARSEIRAAMGRLVPFELGVSAHRVPLGTFATAVLEVDGEVASCATVELVALPVADLFTVSGTATACMDGTVSVELVVGTVDPPGPLGAIVVRVLATLDDVQISIDTRLDDVALPRVLVDPVVLVPGPPDPGRLATLAVGLLTGDIARRLLELLRLELPAARRAALDVVLGQTALLRPDGRVGNLGPLLIQPSEWLAAPGVLALPRIPDVPWVPCLSADGLGRLLGALGDLLELPAGGDALALPWGASLTVAATGAGDAVELIVRWDTPAGSDAVTIDGALRLVIGCGLDVSAVVTTAIEVTGNGLDHARLHVSAGEITTVSVAIKATGAAETTLSLLPTLSGLDSIDADAAAQSVLALVLDALAAHPDLPQLATAIGGIGDALALRAAGAFDADLLRRFGSDPAAHLRTLPVGDAFDDVASLLALIDIDVVLDPAGPSLTITPAPGVEVTLEDPAIGPLQLCLTVTGLEPVGGIRVDGEVCVPGETVPLALRIEAEVVDPELLATAGISLFPRVAAFVGGTAAAPPDDGDRFEAGLWIDAPDADPRHGVFVKQYLGGGATVVVCRETGATDSPDLTACVSAIVEAWVTPLAVELLLAADAVRDFLAGPIASGATTLRALLETAQILEPGEWHLLPGVTDDLVDRVLTLVGEAIEVFAAEPPIDIDPFTVAVTADGGTYGVTLGLGAGLELVSSSDVRLSLTAPPDADGGVTLTLFSLTGTTPTFAPAIQVADVGLRIDHPTGGKLVDLVAGVDAVELLASLALGTGADGGDLELGFDNLTVPIGIAQGSNPVAAKVLSPNNEESQTGDPEDLAPALSPRIELSLLPAPGVTFRLDAGDPPWWIAIQRAFGPIYVEQIGGDIEESDGELVILLFFDGAVAIAGLTVAVDDLTVAIPLPTLYNPSTWGIDLMGLAIGYSGSGVTLAAGLRKNETDVGVEYVGMAQLDALGYALSAIGAYGEFTDPALPGTTYTSMFVFAALSAPLGGPPFFFVTGIGAGLGLNRELELPDDVVDVPGFPLVAAMDASSGFATDPMGSLRGISASFPGRHGTFWLAAGVRFTSFVLLETVAVLAVEIGEGVQVALLGVSHAALPDADTPVANIELALIARFSTEEGVLWVQAQLTDNSWLLSEDCRLTGGFAFVIWFNRSEFIFTVGGYHPRFDVPDHYPVVPKVGYNWTASNALVIKGESYFALASSAIMAGAGFEASYRTSTVWASLSAGVDVLVEWDPLFYDLSAYVKVSAGIDVRICVIVCARVRMSFSMGASVRVWGPKLQGRVKLELGPIDVTVTFGAGAKDEVLTIEWSEFVARFLVQDSPAGEAMSLSPTRGQLAPDPGTTDDTDDGSAARPWRVLPEFALRFETRAASTRIDAVGASSATNPSPLVPSTIDVAPVGVTNVTSTFRVTMVDAASDAVTGLEVENFVISRLPDAPWKWVSREARAPEAGYIDALTGVVMQSTLDVADDDIIVDLAMVDPSLITHALPYFQEVADREVPRLRALVRGGDEFIAVAPRSTPDVYRATATALTAYSAASRATLPADRVSPPRLAPLTEGMLDELRRPVRTREVPTPPPPPPPDRSTLPPVVMGVLRGPLSPAARVAHVTTVDAPPDVPRVTAPSLAAVRTPGGDVARARLDVGSAAVTTRGRTVVPAAHQPVTRAAVRGREFRGGYRAGRRVATTFDAIARRLRDQGHTVAAGDVLVLRMPNARHDDRPARPSLRVAGDQLTRLVALDRAGVPRWERTLRDGEVEIPRGVDRIVVMGVGGAPADRAPAGLAGWHAQMLVHQVASHTYLSPTTVLRTAAPRTRRQGSAVTIANVTAREATAGSTVITHLPATTTAVVIGLSPAGPVADASDAFASLTIGIDGATRATRRDGEVVPPEVVVSGDQVFGVFAVTADDDARWVRVTIASDPRWHVVAVGGTQARPDSLLDDLTDVDPAQLFPPGPGPAGSSTVRYVAADTGPDVGGPQPDASTGGSPS